MRDSRKIHIAIDYSFIGILAFIVSLNSSTTPFWSREPGVDSGVFLYVAQRLSYGEMPYLDNFDHKGPLLYLVDRIALLISPTYGIWIMELIILFISFIIFYKISGLITNNRLIPLIIVTTAAMFIPEFYNEGNTVELIAMPLISLALYVYCKYFFKGSIKNHELILFGITFASVMLLRVNMAAPWCIMCLAVVIKAVKQKQAKEIRRFILFFLTGIALIAVPVFLWLLCRHAFSSFIDQYVIFNIKYSRLIGNANKHYPIYKVFFSFLKEELILVSLLISVVPCILKKDTFSFSLTIMIPFTTILSSISGRMYPHYVLALIPLCIPAIANSIDPINGKLKLQGKKKIIIPVILFVIAGAFPFTKQMYLYGINTSSVLDQDLVLTLDYIDQFTDENDAVAIYGNRDSILYLSQRRSASRYSYQCPVSKFDEIILKEYFEDLEAEKPKLIIIASSSAWDLDLGIITDYLKSNNYEKLPSSDGTIITFVLAEQD